MINQKISAEEASKILGISPNEIRYCLRKGTLPIGNARPATTHKAGKPKYRYDIYRSKVLEYVGLSEWPS